MTFLNMKYPPDPTTFTRNEVENFIIWCSENEVSDITIQEDEQIICHIHGKKHKVTSKRLTNSELVGIITELYKSEAAISILNGGEPLDTSISIPIPSTRGGYLRCRINMISFGLKSSKGYSVSIRIIKDKPYPLEDLKLSPNVIEAFKSKNGLILITGATSSGKSMLLASIIEWRLKDANSHLKIITLESPIEYIYDDVIKPTSSITQVEIGKNIETFPLGIRYALRCTPDVILIGEVRDRESMEQAMIGASSGHLVYSTSHSNGVADVIRQVANRFVFEERHAKIIDLLSSLKMVLAQMLIPSTDGKRIAIREYIIFNEHIIDLLIEADIDNITYEIRKLIPKYGKTFYQDALEKYEEGLISEEELNKIKKQ